MEEMSSKPFKLGVMVGRFQTLHLGHEDMIRKASAICDRTAIFIGSSQESGTYKNPFSYELRKELLKTVFGDSIEVYPLPDIGVGNTAKWGEYVLKNVRERCGEIPDLMISGRESRRTDWFESPDGRNLAELLIPKTVEISASEMREYFIDDDKKTWQSFTSPVLWDRYEELRAIVLASKDILETKSI